MTDLDSFARLGLYGGGGFNPASPKDAAGNSLLVQNGFKPNGSTFESKAGKGTRRPGQQGRRYNFDGTDDIVVVDQAALRITGDLTMAVRFTYDGGAGTSQYILACGEGDEVLEDNTLYGIYINGGNDKIFYFHEHGAGVNVIVDPSITLTSGIEYDLVVTRNTDTKTVDFYLDGVLAGSDTYTTAPGGGTASVFSLGKISNLGSTMFDGKLWDVRIEDSLWTADNIAHYSSKGKIGTQGNVLGWWKCDEQAGTTAYDCSGNGYHGEIQNTSAGFHATQDIYSFQNEVGYTSPLNRDLAPGGVQISYPFAAQPVSSYEISFWFKVANSGTASNTLLVWDNTNGLYYYLQGTGVFRAKHKSVNLATSGNYRDGEWHYAKVSWDGATLTSTVDSETVTAAATGAITSSDTLIALSNNYDSSFAALKIIIDGTTIFDDRNGDPAIDLSGNGNSATNLGDSVLGDGLGIYIPRDESDTTNDVLGNPLQYTGVRPNDGALINSNALTLNGTNQAVRVADNTDLDITDNLTVMCWAKNDASGIGASEHIIGKYDNTADKREWLLYIDGGEKISLAFGDPDNGTLENVSGSVDAVAPKEVNHYAITFSSGTLKMYVNGRSVAYTNTATIPASLFNSDADLTIGSSLSSDSLANFWDGQIFDARVYAGDSTVLTDAEILSVVQNPEANINFDGQTLAAHYKLAEGAGTVCYDASGNGNDGTIENAGSNWSVLQDNVHMNINNGCAKRMYFDGSDYVLLGSNIALTGDFSISFSFIVSDLSTTRTLMGSSNDNIIAFATPDSYKLRVGIGGTIDAFNFTPNVNQYYQATLSRSGTNVSLDVEGEISQTIDYGNSDTLTLRCIGSKTSAGTNQTLGLIWDVSIDDGATGSNDHEWDGYGNTDADWIDQVGSVDGTVSGSPIAVYIPSSDSTPSEDVFGTTLSNPAVNGHNSSETEINFNPDSVPVNANIITGNDFDGSSNIEVPDNALFDITDNLTVCAWAKNDNASLSSGEWVIGKYDTGFDKREWLIGVRSNAEIRVNISSADGSAESSEISVDPITPNVRNHLCFTFESGQVKIYLNGVLMNSTTTGTHVTSLNNDDADLTIGSFLDSDSSSGQWNGSIEQVRIYSGTSTVLTEAQIAQVAAASEKLLAFSGQTLISAMPLLGNTLDYSGNNLHGENNGITMSKYTVPTSYAFGDSLGTQYNHFKREASSVKEDRFLLYRESLLHNSKLSNVEAYTA